MFGEIIGAVTGYKGVKDTNVANRDIASARNALEVHEAAKARNFSEQQASINRDFQASQVDKQLGFQERMSSTAIQRRMEDMRKGGINPILAGKFDASSPAGAAASGGIPATSKANAHGYTAQNKTEAALNRLTTALDLKQKVANIENTEANTGLTTNKGEIIGPISDIMEILSNVTSDLNTSAKQNYPAIVTKLKKTIIDKGIKMKESHETRNKRAGKQISDYHKEALQQLKKIRGQ